MKKLIIMLFAFGLSLTASAQRFGTTKKDDNTGRVLTYAYSSVTFAAVSYHKVNAFETFLNIGKLTAAHTDSINVTNAKVCDKVTLMYLCDTLTAGRVVTFGTNFKSAGTFTIAKNKRGSATFIFDGVYWVENSRAKE